MQVPDELAGRNTVCLGCKALFTVPIPVQRTAQKPVTRECPTCKHPNAPGTAICQRCGTELASGKRPVWHQRPRWWGWQRWTLLGATLVLIAWGAFVGSGFYQQSRERADAEDRLAVQRPEAISPRRAALVTFFNASTQQEARDTVGVMRLLTVGDVADVIEQLADLAQRDASTELSTLKVECACFALSSLTIEPEAPRRALLQAIDAHEDAAERDACLVARGRLGDPRVAEPLSMRWSSALRRELLVTRYRAFDSERLTDEHGTSDRSSNGLARGLRGLAALRGPGVLTPVLEQLWTSQAWLGQDGIDPFARALFDLLGVDRVARRSGESLTRDELIADVRHARDQLVGLARLHAEQSSASGRSAADEGWRVSPSALGAAMIVLNVSAPQYTRVAEQLRAQAAEAFRSATPREQQRLVWSFARVLRRRYANVDSGMPQSEIDRDVVEEWLRWARAVYPTLADVEPATRYPRFATGTYRKYTYQTATERQMIQLFARDWGGLMPRIEQWTRLELGCSPLLRTAIDPGGVESPDSAFAAACLLIARCGDQRARESLEIWADAVDQPAWVRSVARTTLAVLATQRNEGLFDWPANLESEAFAPDSPAPVEIFGDLITSGGEALATALRGPRAAQLSGETRQRLSIAAGLTSEDDIR